MFDENATDLTENVKKGQTVWAPLPPVHIKSQQQPPIAGECKPAFSVYKDEGPVKVQRQPLAPITQSLEDSACSFASVNTSLHQLDYLLQTREHISKEAFKIQVSFS